MIVVGSERLRLATLFCVGTVVGGGRRLVLSTRTLVPSTFISSWYNVFFSAIVGVFLAFTGDVDSD